MMTFEEMQKTLETMLAVQRELQVTQLQQQSALTELIKKYGDLAEATTKQKAILDQLIGYSLTNESDHLDLEEKLLVLQAKVRRLEEKYPP
jgi:DNA repair exonuclease SbcCD ATPase subunit